MKYMGSKARLVNEILPIILKDRKPNQWFIDLFCGGCSISQEVDGKVIANDKKQVLSNEDYKNTVFRNFKTAKDIVEESKSFDKTIVDDHIETESCEIFSNCGDLE